ncbi:tyrosine-type recombinase/integrase [Motilimonas sp. 1_MG-2023]|uniref:tyrosine-type recombinase/integrase n=1 Tax=Motilimonas sp. 1_MG-2023 TaxID=3062672 RepID=UPI0026E16DCB|nr:tyrosine-type recombinase/integrase [Motilimonas sp. 1_MG-2023]MDO6524718.1 tyrosine-type recombinase/integrase [Motilimonas sp. 1_MG-2023]
MRKVNSEPTEAPPSCNHPVTIDKDGAVISSYQDNIWDFSHEIHSKNVSKARRIINFSITLENKTNLSDVINENYMNGLKEYLYVRKNIPHPHSNKVISAQTIISKFYHSLSVINYLIHIKKTCFSSFDSSDTKGVISYLKNRNPSISNNSLLKILSVIQDLYLFNEKLKHGIKSHPFHGESVVSLSNDRRLQGGTAENQTPCIPDYICSELLKKSVDYLLDNSERIIKANASSDKKISEMYSRYYKKNKNSRDTKINRKDRNTIHLICKSRGYTEFMKKKLLFHGFNGKLDLNRSTNKARTCCYVILALTTGMRNSELASLTAFSLIKSTGWDNEEYLWVQGHTYKLEDEPKLVKWMVPDLAEIVFNHLKEMSLMNNKRIMRSLPYLENTEARRQEDLLFLLFIANDTKTNTFNGLSNSHWNSSLKSLSIEFDLRTDGSDNDLKLPKNSVWPLSSHQFRRTFATLAARSALGDLRYLREHFKHWSLDMTLYYANNDKFDDSLFDEILTERNELQRAIVSDWLISDKELTGGRGEVIASFRHRGNLKTAENLPELSRQISDNIFIRGTGHSWCLASGDGCGGEGLYDAIQCVDCENSVIDKTHASIWSGIKQQSEILLELADSGLPTKQKAKQYIEKAEKIISIFNDENNEQ